MSGEMVNIEDDECNHVSSSKTRRDRSYPRTIDEEPKKTFFGWAGRHSWGYGEVVSDEESGHFPQQIPVKFKRFGYTLSPHSGSVIVQYSSIIYRTCTTSE